MREDSSHLIVEGMSSMDANEDLKTRHEDVLGELADACGIGENPVAGPREAHMSGFGGVPIQEWRSRVAGDSPIEPATLVQAIEALVGELDAAAVPVRKPDGAIRVDLFEPDDTLHSITLIRDNTVMQVTSFTTCAPERANAREQILAGLPSVSDPRIEALMAEETIVGPDYPSVP